MNDEDNKIELTLEENWGVEHIDGWGTCWEVNPDIVEVVRCKNCKHSRTDDSNYDCYRCELTPGRAHFASSFCDMGEKRDNEQDQ